MRTVLVLAMCATLSGCTLPEIHIIDRPDAQKSVDPNNTPPTLLSCSGVSTYRGNPVEADSLISGVQDPGKFGLGLVIVHFVVTAEGRVDPGTIEIRENGENIGRGMSSLSPTRAMILE